MRIGLDIDGVMYMWEKTARYMLREVLPNSPYKTDPNMKVHLTWDWIQDHISKDHWNWLWTEGVRLGLFRYGHSYPGTIQAVRRLAELGEVVVITHRPKQAVSDTLAWLTYQNLPLAGVHLLTNKEPKSSVHPQCHIYLDDKPENCKDLALRTNAFTVALQDRPWNQAYATPYNIKRIKTWQDFITLVEGVV